MPTKDTNMTPRRSPACAASQMFAAAVFSAFLTGITGRSSNSDPPLFAASRKVRLTHPACTLHSTATSVLAPAERCARSLRVPTAGT